jgi:hypothetical protein
MAQSDWRVLATYASGLEADIVIARLEAEEIPAMRDSHDASGIFGAGFQGATSRGVTVRVPAALLEDARIALTPASEDEP